MIIPQRYTCTLYLNFGIGYNRLSYRDVGESRLPLKETQEFTLCRFLSFLFLQLI